jgi:hypothetical protein
MKVARVGVVVGLAAIAVAGCRPDDTGAVLLHVSARAGAPVPPTYSSSTAAAAFTADGLVHLTATSNEGLLRLVIFGPLVAGAILELPVDAVHFAIGDADWANDAGTLEVLTVEGNIGGSDPATVVSFVALPMSARSAGATGSFVFDGGGTYR